MRKLTVAKVINVCKPLARRRMPAGRPARVRFGDDRLTCHVDPRLGCHNGASPVRTLDSAISPIGALQIETDGAADLSAGGGRRKSMMPPS